MYDGEKASINYEPTIYRSGTNWIELSNGLIIQWGQLNYNSSNGQWINLPISFTTSSYSALATLGFSGFYGVFELFPPLFPQIAQHPLVASVVGAMFVGISCGICVAVGGAPSGDDAMAMGLSKLSGWPLQWIYLLSDLTVLLLSLTYIPVQRMVYSLLTVILSGQIIGLMTRPKMRNFFNPPRDPAQLGA